MYQHGKRVEGIITKDQLIYDGIINNNIFQGRGKITLKDNTVYDGYFR